MEGMGMAPPQQSSSHHPAAAAMAPEGTPRRMHMGGMHMTFFWGEEAQILFTGWPGRRGLSAYLLALLAVFVLALLVESLSYTAHRIAALTRRGGVGRGSTSTVSAGSAQTVVHALRMGLAYVVMLAVMSFNGGVLLAAVAGHALGYFFLGSGAFGRGAHDGPIIEDKC